MWGLLIDILLLSTSGLRNKRDISCLNFNMTDVYSQVFLGVIEHRRRLRCTLTGGSMCSWTVPCVQGEQGTSECALKTSSILDNSHDHLQIDICHVEV